MIDEELNAMIVWLEKRFDGDEVKFISRKGLMGDGADAIEEYHITVNGTPVKLIYQFSTEEEE